jgi:WD40 repeat protein
LPDGGNVFAIAFAPDESLLSLEGHQAQINALAFSPDGSILASCDHQGKVKLWRALWPGLAIGR